MGLVATLSLHETATLHSLVFFWTYLGSLLSHHLSYKAVETFISLLELGARMEHARDVQEGGWARDYKGSTLDLQT